MCKRKECWRRSTRTSISISQRKRINTLPRDMPCLLKNVFKWRMAIVWERERERERERDMQKNAEKYSSGKVNRPGAKSKFFFFPTLPAIGILEGFIALLFSTPFHSEFFFSSLIFHFRFFFSDFFSIFQFIRNWWSDEQNAYMNCIKISIN